MSSVPKVKAFLICDQVIHGQDGKHSVVGIFRRIHSQQFPVFHARFGLYMMLGGMNGTYNFRIEFIDPTNEEALGKAELKGVKHDRPLEDFETGINLPGLQFPYAGTFEVRVFCNDNLLHVDTMQAIPVNPPTDGPTNSSENPEL